MRFLLTAVGTRGDVQPALALALALRQRGHGVRLCISPNFIEWAERLGLEARPMGVEMRMPRQAGGTPPALTPEELRRLRESMPDLITDQFETVGAAVEGCDAIVGANAHQYAGPSVAEHRGIRCVTAVYAPVSIPSPDEAGRKMTAAWNERALERVNRNRASLGLGPIDDVLEYALTPRTWLAADAVLAPASDVQGREVVQTGAWVLADVAPLPEDLQTFLESGEPPIYAGFGSMPAPADATRQLVHTARALGRRIIVSKGWADLELIDESRDAIAIGDVSHDVLFPRVAVVIHHGGAGTTAAAARAGVPQVITPMFADQFYWGGRVAALSAGTAIPHATMTAESLTRALGEALDPNIAAGARALAPRVRRDGADVAARLLTSDF
jgi:vancomycin aglycone glucosyltransferase